MSYKEYSVRIHDDGTKEWYWNGKYHREDGPAIEDADGDKYWYLNGELHRVDGPACDYANGTKRWYLNSKLHREDGPAVEYANGIKYWYLNGIFFSEEEWKKEVAKLHKPTSSCEGKIIEVDGRKYRLMEI